MFQFFAGAVTEPEPNSSNALYGGCSQNGKEHSTQDTQLMIKANLFLCLTKHYATKTYGGVAV
jgi:hypothetical protein